MSYVMDLPVDAFFELIKTAFHKREEERHWMLYCSAYPHFDKTTFKTFEQFYKRPTETVSTRSAEEILADAERIRKKAGEKRGTV